MHRLILRIFTLIFWFKYSLLFYIFTIYTSFPFLYSCLRIVFLLFLQKILFFLLTLLISWVYWLWIFILQSLVQHLMEIKIVRFNSNIISRIFRSNTRRSLMLLNILKHSIILRPSIRIPLTNFECIFHLQILLYKLIIVDPHFWILLIFVLQVLLSNKLVCLKQIWISLYVLFVQEPLCGDQFF